MSKDISKDINKANAGAKNGGGGRAFRDIRE